VKSLTTIFLAGIIFALGLGISGMTDTNKVIGFLNLAGDWDVSLAFVMIGAIGMHLALFRLILKRSAPVFGSEFHLPTRKDIDTRLVIGSALFGVGWGLGGFCPGPGIVSGASLGVEALIFVAGMTGGMLVFHQLDAALQERKTPHAKPTRTTSAT